MQKLRIHWKICLQIKGNMLAVVGSGMSSFKLAAAFMEKEKRVLFADADFSQEVFFGKI
ncbi:MAG: hypothetical protein ACLTH3_02825 [Lachnospira sp.]